MPVTTTIGSQRLLLDLHMVGTQEIKQVRVIPATALSSCWCHLHVTRQAPGTGEER